MPEAKQYTLTRQMQDKSGFAKNFLQNGNYYARPQGHTGGYWSTVVSFPSKKGFHNRVRS